MSRSGYSEDCDDTWASIRWRGAVTSALRGKRGQEFLRELITALDAMPEKRLIAHELEAEGEVCALGAVGKLRGLDMSKLDPEDNAKVAATFQIPHALACEIMWENDEHYFSHGDEAEKRWQRIRKWAESNLIEWDAP